MQLCQRSFDGRGKVLAHTEYPNLYNKPIEILIEQDKFGTWK